MKSTCYGLVAEFDSPEKLVSAAALARATGYWRMDAFSPFPVDGLFEALGKRRTILPLLVLTWVWSWYFCWSLALAALLGWRSGLAWLVVGYTLVVLPLVYAHQYLGDQFPAALVLVMALGPPVVTFAGRELVAVRRAAVERRV